MTSDVGRARASGADDGATTFDAAYFEGMYATDADPWGFEHRWYERRKYAITIAALGAPRYRRAFEPGCANGALTELLATRCDRIVASDIVPAVAARARRRLSGRGDCAVTVVEAPFPDWWPDGTGDLVVWSEVAYYLTERGGEIAMARLEQWLEPGGELVAVHYLGETNYPRHGAEIAPWVDAQPFLARTLAVSDEHFALGVWRRVG